MATIKDCSITVDGSGNQITEDGGFQEVVVSGTVGIGSLTGVEADVEAIILSAEFDPPTISRTIQMFPGDNSFELRQKFDPVLAGFPDPPTQIPVSVNVSNVPDPASVDCGEIEYVGSDDGTAPGDGTDGFDPNAVTVQSCSVSPQEPTTGEEVTLTLRIDNPNPQPAAFDVDVYFNGGFEDRFEATVPAETVGQLVDVPWDSTGWGVVSPTTGTIGYDVLNIRAQ